MGSNGDELFANFLGNTYVEMKIRIFFVFNLSEPANVLPEKNFITLDYELHLSPQNPLPPNANSANLSILLLPTCSELTRKMKFGLQQNMHKIGTKEKKIVSKLNIKDSIQEMLSYKKASNHVRHAGEERGECWFLR